MFDGDDDGDVYDGDDDGDDYDGDDYDNDIDYEACILLPMVVHVVIGKLIYCTVIYSPVQSLIGMTIISKCTNECVVRN